VYARTDDFNFHCSPFHLTITLDGKDVKLLAHTVDAWTIFTHNNPVDDDTAPKLVKITFELEKGQTIDARTQARLDEMFVGNIGKTFAFIGVANQHELVISPLGYPFTAARSRWQLVMRADGSTRTLAKIKPASKLVAQHASACEALKAIRDQRADIERRLALFSGLEVTLPGGSAVVDTASIVTTLRYTWEIVGIGLSAYELHLPAVLAAPSLAYSRWLDSSRDDFEKTQRELSRSCSQP
jgi:hypothetical protein